MYRFAVSSWLAFILIAISFCLPTAISAQTLSEQLLREDPTKLAKQAREKGNIVRGAILYHQGNINCAKCHRSVSEKDRFGPDLSRMDQKATDEHIIESILLPSKTIKEGFEPTIVLTTDGKVLQGIVAQRDEKKIILRDRENIDQLFTIPLAEIERSKPGKISTMPDGLANELKDRQQFLDLVRYVIDVKERGPESTSLFGQQPKRTLGSLIEGIVHVNEFGCINCHQQEKQVAFVDPKLAPKLSWSGKHLNPHYLQKFIANPHESKPGTRMPHMLAQLAPQDQISISTAITHYLVSTNNQFAHSESIESKSIEQGEFLFHSVGCVACHSSRKSDSTELGLVNSVPLGELSNKYDLKSLISFLDDPHLSRRSGRMPKMKLTHFETDEIASFLLQNSLRTETKRPKWIPDEELAQRGEKYFRDFKCNSCHDPPDKPRTEASLSIALDKLRPRHGCLSDQAENLTDGIPVYQFESTQREAITHALNNWPSQLSSEQQIDISLTTFNCLACHERDNLGGVSSIRDAHFHTTNLNLGDQGRIPPTLTQVGAKLNRKWMRDVLVNGRSVRPYMKTTMPQFGEDNIGHLIDLFQTTDQMPEIEFGEFEDRKETRKQGLVMAGSDGLNCVACHTYKFKLSDTMPAVDLTEMSERLQKKWFYHYMLNPQQFSPNTVMPSFWPNGNAIRDDIDGDATFQVEALWQYLIDGRQAGTPRGVVREPLEIVVKNKTQMLRRSYPGIGKRGIGVGYPGGVNLAFDAEQMRLAMFWDGKFADPGGVWTGQGSGNVRPMNRPRQLAKGPDLDRLENPWVVDDGRPPNHQFKGYELDEDRNPTFVYQYRKADVRDFFLPIANSPDGTIGLKRNVSIKSAVVVNGLRFRLASGDSIERKADNQFAVDDLQVKISTDHVTEIVSSENGKQLFLLVDLEADETTELEAEYMWNKK